MAVKYRGLGYVTVTTAGTPVPLASTDIRAAGCLIQAASTNAGVLYVGGDDLTSLLRGCEISPGDAISIDGPMIGGIEEEFMLSEVKIDAATSGDKVLVSYFIRRG